MSGLDGASESGFPLWATCMNKADTGLHRIPEMSAHHIHSRETKPPGREQQAAKRGGSLRSTVGSASLWPATDLSTQAGMDRPLSLKSYVAYE